MVCYIVLSYQLKNNFMKTLLFVIASICFYTTAQSQNTDYFNKLTTEAKALIEKKSFVGAQTKIGQLERELTKIKTATPSFNVTGLEAEVKTLKESLTQSKDKSNSERTAGQNATVNNIKIDKLLDEVFNIGAFSFSDLEKAQAENDAYKAQANELLGLKTALTAYIADMKKGNNYERFVGKMKMSYDRTFETFVERKERILAQSTGGEESNWKNAYYEMQAEQIHWDAAQKVFPDEPKFAEAYQKITAIVNKYGGLDKISAQNKVNNTEKIKNQFLPAAIVKDANLEKMFVDAFNKRYATEYKGTATKAIILQRDWQTERNTLTGIVTGRIRQAAIVYKGTDGKCYLVSIMHLYQEYIGSSFQNTKAVYAQNAQEMLCENVK
jgi:hypothetical protein